jgi:hypothetical protein
MSDVDRVVEYCVANLFLGPDVEGDEYGYVHLPLCVIDAVYSINVRYEAVVNVVDRYCRFVGINKTNEPVDVAPVVAVEMRLPVVSPDLAPSTAQAVAAQDRNAGGGFFERIARAFSTGDQAYTYAPPAPAIRPATKVAIVSEAIADEPRARHPAAVTEHTINDFLDVVSRYTPEELAADVFQNRGRTSPRNGILKADAVVQFAKVVRICAINTLSEMKATSRQRELEARLTQIPGQGSGISLKYFYMLCGAQHLVKPDRMIYRFLERALGRSVTADEAQDLLTRACARLQTDYPHMTPRKLDGRIWRYQRQAGAE